MGDHTMAIDTRWNSGNDNDGRYGFNSLSVYG